jgi:hypothetical protein
MEVIYDPNSTYYDCSCLDSTRKFLNSPLNLANSLETNIKTPLRNLKNSLHTENSSTSLKLNGEHQLNCTNSFNREFTTTLDFVQYSRERTPSKTLFRQNNSFLENNLRLHEDYKSDSKVSRDFSKGGLQELYRHLKPVVTLDEMAYDYTDLSDEFKEFICSICAEPFLDPVDTSCGYLCIILFLI